jgi:hypothetical protein
MTHNLKIISQNVPFSKLDSDFYNLERIYGDLDIVSSTHFKEHRLPRI